MSQEDFCHLVRETVQENMLTRVLIKLGGIRSSLEAIAGGTELMLGTGLNQIQVMQGAFLPTVVEENVTPKSIEGGHLIEEGEGEEEGNDGEETSL